jgi:Cys-tRNA synthase (O-phospho-L-seryl-tRNA:Cys-tRNA synthase)
MSRPVTCDTHTMPQFTQRVKEWFRTQREARHALNLEQWSLGKFRLILQLEQLPQDDIIRFETALITWAKSKRAREGANDLLDRQIYELECSRELRKGQAV